MTNFEKIKSMDIDELAEFLYCVDCLDLGRKIIDNEIMLDEKASIKEWLESEVE